MFARLMLRNAIILPWNHLLSSQSPAEQLRQAPAEVYTTLVVRGFEEFLSRVTVRNLRTESVEAYAAAGIA